MISAAYRISYILAHPVIDPNYLSFDYGRSSFLWMICNLKFRFLDLISLRSFANISLHVSQRQPIANLLVEQEFPPPRADLEK